MEDSTIARSKQTSRKLKGQGTDRTDMRDLKETEICDLEKDSLRDKVRREL